MRETEFTLHSEHITLDALLKAAGLAPSGGAAKTLIQAGKVQVDGQAELRRGKKLRAGQVVALDGVRVRLIGTAVDTSRASAVADPQK